LHPGRRVAGRGLPDPLALLHVPVRSKGPPAEVTWGTCVAALLDGRTRPGITLPSRRNGGADDAGPEPPDCRGALGRGVVAVPSRRADGPAVRRRHRRSGGAQRGRTAG